MENNQKNTSPSDEPEESWLGSEPVVPEDAASPDVEPTRKGFPWEPVLAGLIFLVLAFVVWWNFPVVDQLFRGRYTSTPKPLPPTVTPRPTRTATPLQPPTFTPQPSNTPYPPSAYVVTDIPSLEPALPGLGSGSVVLNNDSITPDPSFIHPQWYPSERLNLPGTIGLKEPYFATFGPGSVTWMMDMPLAPGYYEVNVLDTLYSSAGSLEFKVRLGGTELTPLIGPTRIYYRSSQGEDPQMDDVWQSLGVYYLDRPDLLSVFAQWQKRDEFSIVAVDRVLIVPLSPSVNDMIARLPAMPLRYIVDDLEAEIDGADTLVSFDDTLSWNGKMQTVVNPQKDLKVIWETRNLLPSGPYTVAIWVPGLHNKSQVELKVLVNGKEMPGGPLPMKQSDWKDGQWVSLGVWDSTLSGKYVRLGVQMDVKGGTPGEVAIDAVAFLKNPTPEPSPTP